ncbi:MAG TPA: 2-C-methyl-D-erythritol 2,4-cyclodiphosphate synthase [Acidimicrobiales bacterium]|nr:2-C-methyl-D-erythritol 2,4-cyclodiphosphate synthase [Acidimicrobiales bacterium]
MSEQRIGLGVDLHRFLAEGEAPRPLVLGGVCFAEERGLSGHSDADALAHALADALLGAAGLGDIGSHFPDTDEAWRGADSLQLLGACARLLGRDGWRLVNADCTVVAEAPRLAPARAEMAARLSAAAGGPVHVKATRAERLGSLGRLEGLACLAVALLER